MCKARQEQEHQETTEVRKKPYPKAMKKEIIICCELCRKRASLYCEADSAFLCRKCDKLVHGANFLAQRHMRCLLCSSCRSFTRRYVVGSCPNSAEECRG